MKLLGGKWVLDLHPLELAICFHLHLLLSDDYPLVSLSALSSFRALPGAWQWACRHYGLTGGHGLVLRIQADSQIWNWYDLSLVFVHAHISIFLMAG